ncbi:unnamed protein product [Amoebophrya sp. A25]|nr:unnamed protein product [Amoebophrya sp. A25]|eukprot:GSA25T00010654001.1
MLRHGRDIESAGSARNTPSDDATPSDEGTPSEQGSPSDECGGSPGKDAEAQALPRRKHVSGKEQRGKGSACSPGPAPSTDKGGNQAGKKNHPRATAEDRRRRACSWCQVFAAVTTVGLLLSVCFYFYYKRDAVAFAVFDYCWSCATGATATVLDLLPATAFPGFVLEFLDQSKTSRPGEGCFCDVEPTASSALESSCCGSTNEGPQRPRVSSSASSDLVSPIEDTPPGGAQPAAAPSRAAADGGGSGSAPTTSDGGSPQASTEALGGSTEALGGDSATAAFRDSSTSGPGAASGSKDAAGGGDSRAVQPPHDGSIKDVAGGGDSQLPDTPDALKRALAADNSGKAVLVSNTKLAGKLRLVSRFFSCSDRIPRAAPMRVFALLWMSPARDLSESDFEEFRHVCCDMNPRSSGAPNGRCPKDAYLVNELHPVSADAVLKYPLAQQHGQQEFAEVTFAESPPLSVLPGQGSADEITVVVKGATKEAAALLRIDEGATLEVKLSDLRLGRAPPSDSELSKDDSDTNWPPVFVRDSKWLPPNCIPNPQKTCQWSVQDGEPNPLHKFAGNVLCSGPQLGLSRLMQVVVPTLEKTFPNRLGNMLFPLEGAKADASIRCEVITKGFVNKNLLGPALDATPKSNNKVRDWFASQSWSKQGVPSWSNSDEDDATVCCVNAKAEEERQQLQKKTAEANALQCVPIQDTCKVAIEVADNGRPATIQKEVGEFVCRKSSAVMQDREQLQRDGISDCKGITRKLITSKNSIKSGQPAWERALETELKDNLVLPDILNWIGRENPEESCCEATRKAIAQRAIRLSKCFPTKQCEWSWKTKNDAYTTRNGPAGAALCGQMDPVLGDKVATALFGDVEDLTYMTEPKDFACSGVITRGVLRDEERMRGIAKALGWQGLPQWRNAEIDKTACCMSENEKGFFDWLEVSKTCVPLESVEACKMKRTEGTFFFPAADLCDARRSPFGEGWYVPDKYDPPRLPTKLFGIDSGISGDISCSTITRGFLGKNFHVLQEVINRHYSKSDQWVQEVLEGNDDTACCKSTDEVDKQERWAAEEKERQEQAKANRHAEDTTALQCVPIAGSCMVASRREDHIDIQYDKIRIIDGNREAGEFFCKRGSPVMQKKPHGIQDCASITRNLIDEVSKQNPPADSAWAEAFEQAAEHRDNVWKLIYHPGHGIRWDRKRQGQNENEPCCEESPSISEPYRLH